jgi:hypothetical protein
MSRDLLSADAGDEFTELVDSVRRLRAMQEIRDVIVGYAVTYDDHDWVAFADLWAEDAAFEVDGVAFEGKAALLEFLTTCLPDEYMGKHMNSIPWIELGADGVSASARTDVVWIAQNRANTIVARYDDTFVKQGARWRFARRVETAVEHRDGAPPMSATALAVSALAMSGRDADEPS